MPTQPPPAVEAPPIPLLDALRRDVLAERLHRQLDGGTPRPDSRYQRRELALHIVSAYEAQQGLVDFQNAGALQTYFLTSLKLEKERYYDALKFRAEAGGSRDQYIVSFITPVLTDAVTDRDYCQLPPDFVALRQYQKLPGDGVFDVLPLGRADRRRYPFAPLLGSQDSLVRDLFRGGLGQYFFIRRGERLEIETESGYLRAAQRWPELDLRLVIRNLGADELPPPGLLQAAQDSDILTRALKLALKVGEEDKYNDDNASTAKS